MNKTPTNKYNAALVPTIIATLSSLIAAVSGIVTGIATAKAVDNYTNFEKYGSLTPGMMTGVNNEDVGRDTGNH